MLPSDARPRPIDRLERWLGGRQEEIIQLATGATCDLRYERDAMARTATYLSTVANIWFNPSDCRMGSSVKCEGSSLAHRGPRAPSTCFCMSFLDDEESSWRACQSCGATRGVGTLSANVSGSKVAALSTCAASPKSPKSPKSSSPSSPDAATVSAGVPNSSKSSKPSCAEDGAGDGSEKAGGGIVSEVRGEELHIDAPMSNSSSMSAGSWRSSRR